jgi:hypothetical protein
MTRPLSLTPPVPSQGHPQGLWGTAQSTLPFRILLRAVPTQPPAQPSSDRILRPAAIWTMIGQRRSRLFTFTAVPFQFAAGLVAEALAHGKGSLALSSAPPTPIRAAMNITPLAVTFGIIAISADAIALVLLPLRFVQCSRSATRPLRVAFLIVNVLAIICLIAMKEHSFLCD